MQLLSYTCAGDMVRTHTQQIKQQNLISFGCTPRILFIRFDSIRFAIRIDDAARRARAIRTARVRAAQVPAADRVRARDRSICVFFVVCKTNSRFPLCRVRFSTENGFGSRYSHIAIRFRSFVHQHVGCYIDQKEKRAMTQLATLQTP